jgi:DeoR/GlpR family transcriptional regulator of sugar metabolism
MVDHTKWGRISSATFCRTDRLSGVFTDSGAPNDMVATLRDMEIEVVEVRPSTPPSPSAVESRPTVAS